MQPPVQWGCAAIEIPRGADPDGLCARPQRKPGEGRVAHSRSGREWRADHLRGGVVPVAIFLPRREGGAVRPGGGNSWTDDGELYGPGPRAGSGDHRVGIRTARGGGLSQYGGGDRRRRVVVGAVPQDAHPGRSVVLRKILLHAGGPGVPVLRYALCAAGAAGVLGPVVSGSGAAGGAGRRAGAVLPDGDRLAPRGEGGARRGAARCVAHHPTLTRHRQRALRGGGEPGWIRRASRERAGILGRVVCGRSIRAGAGGGVRRPRRDADCGVRPAAHRRSAAQLAVPARPAHRRLRRDLQPGDRLKGATPRGSRLKSPLALGFRMPAEWEPHEATWIAWPRNRADWPGRFAPIPWVYGEIVRKLSRVERVRILVENAQVERQARRVLRIVDA